MSAWTVKGGETMTKTYPGVLLQKRIYRHRWLVQQRIRSLEGLIELYESYRSIRELSAGSEDVIGAAHARMLQELALLSYGLAEMGGEL